METENKLFFIGKAKLNHIEKVLSIKKDDFIEFYNTISTKKYYIDKSKYMIFNDVFKNKFIEKFPILKEYLNKLYNEWESVENNLKQKFITDYFQYIPVEKQQKFSNDLNKLK